MNATQLQWTSEEEEQSVETTTYTRDLFDDEGPFGEADCAGL